MKTILKNTTPVNRGALIFTDRGKLSM